MTLASEIGAKRVMHLPVSVPAHCDLMIPAARRLTIHLTETRIRSADVRVVHSTDATSYEDADALEYARVRQLYSPVRWMGTVRAFATLGATSVLEFDTGRVLTGLAKRIDRSFQSLYVHDPFSLEQALAKFGTLV